MIHAIFTTSNLRHLDGAFQAVSGAFQDVGGAFHTVGGAFQTVSGAFQGVYVSCCADVVLFHERVMLA